MTIFTGLLYFPEMIFPLSLDTFSIKNNVNGKNSSGLKQRDYFAICLIVKDDHLDIVEWIEYHKRMGCSKFYITDHNSSIPMLNTIRDYVSDGLVEYFFSDLRLHARAQLHVYNECLTKYGKRHKFMAFIDSDEFIVVTNSTQTIPDILKNYEQFGGVALNWKLFGSSGHVKRPSGGVLPNYHLCCPNIHIKSIVNTQFTIKTGSNPHMFVYEPGYFAVDTALHPVFGPFNINTSLPAPQYVYDIMYINHYNLKSEEDFKRKSARGRKCDDPAPFHTTYFRDVNAAATNICEILQMPTISVTLQ